MKRFALQSVLLAMLAVIPSATTVWGQSQAKASRDWNDQGTFEIYSGGKSIGTDIFHIRVHGDRVEAEGAGHLQVEQNGQTIEVQTTSDFVLDSQLNPISYNWSQTGAQSSHLSVDFRSQPAHARYKQVNGQEDKHDFKLDADVVVLDDNEIHHYELALDRYDASKGGPMVLGGFTPQEAQPGVIILNFVGTQMVNLNGNQALLRHFTLAVATTLIDLWADEQGRLQMVSAPGLQFQALRKRE